MKCFWASLLILTIFEYHCCTEQQCNQVLQDVLKQVRNLEYSIKNMMHKRGMSETPGKIGYVSNKIFIHYVL